ncbi:MAG: family 43 glycosylhydrolase [Clostridia bacterium]|nr:family 43 glycosylhydrolase [Clostridia bacterium]
MSQKDPICLRRTYCNPLSIPDIPRGDSVDCRHEKEHEIYRSIADPSVMYHGGKWYLYPSYGMCWVSEDLVSWKHVRTEPYNMKYSPTVIGWKNKFLMTSHSNGLYVSDSPVGPFEYLGDFILPCGKTKRFADPALFADDDGRIYLYYCDADPEDERGLVCSWGVELEKDDPRRFKGEPRVINRFCSEHFWERSGPYNEDAESGWIEGQWMIKHKGRYYFIYSSPNTEYKSYCMAVYYSDVSPLEGFVCQMRNPLTEHRSGLVSGAGHGCVTHGPDGTLWAFYTTTLCAAHIFERRIGMDPVFVDENGELYCRVTDTPQFGCGEADEPEKDNSAGLLPVTFYRRGSVKASSESEGRSAFYALDESMLTWWQPEDADPEPTLTLDTEGDYVCEAARVIWRDVGLDYDAGIVPGPFRYVIEGRTSGGEWTALVDARDNETDLAIDYRSFPPVCCRELRLRITGSPKGITPGLISMCVFGTRKRRNETEEK